MRAAYQAPPAVCGQWAEIYPGGRVGAGQVALPEQFLPELVGWLRDPSCLLVGAETSFDILVPCTTADLTHKHMARELGLDPECPGTSLLELFVDALDANRVTDVFIRQKLIDLARGCYRYERNIDGTTTGVNKYNLADLAKRVAGIHMPGESKHCAVCGKNPKGCPACPWRMRYAELRGMPVAQWPREAYEYAALDPVATAAVWVGQLRPSTKIETNFPGVSVSDVLAGEFEEMRAALPLKAMSAYGLRTDPGAVALFEANVREQYAAVSETLVKAGLLRREYKRDREALKAFIAREGLERHFQTTDGAGLPAWSFAKDCFTAATHAIGMNDERSELLWLWHAGDAADPDLLAAGLSFVKETKNTKAAHALVIWAHTSTGAPCVPDVFMTDGGESGKPVPKTDKDSLLVAADLVESALARGRYDHMPGGSDRAQEAAEALRDYAELGHLTKQLSTDIPVLKSGAEVPIHTRYETTLETERASSSSPNVQNQARGGKVKCRACKGKGKTEAGPCVKCDGEGSRDLPGTRECFVPRKGWVLIDADYSMLEIYALAQVCLWELGFSGMAEALNPNQPGGAKDVHLIVASQILGMSYAEAKVIYKDDTHPRQGEVKNARNAGKAVNFGRPGGLSAKTMRSYAVKSYGVNLPVNAPPENPDAPNWTDIIRKWNETWTEMPAYFSYVDRQESYPNSGLYNVRYPSPATGARAGLDGYRALATYCAACNTKYQRTGARVAKRALWKVFKACYTRTAPGAFEPVYLDGMVVGRQPVLFGCRPDNFIHDQIMCEAPEERAHRAGQALAALMNEAGREICPDVPPSTEPVLCRRWSKNAAERREPCGTCGAAEHEKCVKGCAVGTGRRVLIPWDDERLAG